MLKKRVCEGILQTATNGRDSLRLEGRVVDRTLLIFEGFQAQESCCSGLQAGTRPQSDVCWPATNVSLGATVRFDRRRQPRGTYILLELCVLICRDLEMIQEFALVGYRLKIRPTPGRPFRDDIAVDGEQRQGQLDDSWCCHDARDSINRVGGETE